MPKTPSARWLQIADQVADLGDCIESAGNIEDTFGITGDGFGYRHSSTGFLLRATSISQEHETSTLADAL